MSELEKNENIFYNEISEILKQSRNATYKAVNLKITIELPVLNKIYLPLQDKLKYWIIYSC